MYVCVCVQVWFNNKGWISDLTCNGGVHVCHVCVQVWFNKGWISIVAYMN